MAWILIISSLLFCMKYSFKAQATQVNLTIILFPSNEKKLDSTSYCLEMLKLILAQKQLT
jgi:hypothetical protein